ncbi:hypothetical protein ODDIEODDIE_67 [Escherichia phage vB_EcoS_OddieOddie]|nr:hypothetical protein ODDIEODDIE_67 [Escherichia phage vB_EcoS_OddieOddie]
MRFTPKRKNLLHQLIVFIKVFSNSGTTKLRKTLQNSQNFRSHCANRGAPTIPTQNFPSHVVIY